ncbi:hypothetical protein DAPPUDRAFT_314218 [Daphnia pulex]|uniref:Uncharacterized protein n=1 Tax=Daphnia pulex TaxID=6669 RepID=E9G501_DAPPU|nr:hypothetical protein DAPPUDRAFT_314218 [Daphnia pulex]|eukprot:EFX85469.1 hypothetical protein DAPPUDRAFT_314218 [Daphnia pulex]
MSASAPVKPSGIKPPTSRLARPSVTSKPASNGSSGENMSKISNESDGPKKKLVDILILVPPLWCFEHGVVFA